MVRNIFSYTLDSGAGSQTILSTIDHDLSRADALRIVFNLTKAQTDAGDTLNVRLQEFNGIVWSTRARLPQYLGTATVSSTAPESYEMVIPALETLNNSEKGFEPSGSAGGTEIAAGQVVSGPFRGWHYSSSAPAQAGAHLRSARYRLKIDIVDADSDADFEGEITILADTPGYRSQ